MDKIKYSSFCRLLHRGLFLLAIIAGFAHAEGRERCGSVYAAVTTYAARGSAEQAPVLVLDGLKMALSIILRNPRMTPSLRSEFSQAQSLRQALQNFQLAVRAQHSSSESILFLSTLEQWMEAAGKLTGQEQEALFQHWQEEVNSRQAQEKLSPDRIREDNRRTSRTGEKDEPCGQSGTVKERLEDCSGTYLSEITTSKNKLWKLVSRSQEGKTLWQDAETKLIWGDTLSEKMNHDDALKACMEKEKLTPLMANTPELIWSLPTNEDFDSAEQNGIREVLGDMKDHCFWSSSPYDAYAWVFNGYGGRVDGGVYRDDHRTVRCVGR